MNIWSKNKLLFDYIENTLHFRDFKLWKNIFSIDPIKEKWSNDEIILTKILQADCHFYLNDG